MLTLYNSLGKKREVFEPVNKEVVTLFTCGPSVYQRSHIGNFRTFLFEDVLQRYLEYTGYTVTRGLNITDIEDKALTEAQKEKTGVKELTRRNIRHFLAEMKLLRMRVPDHMPMASQNVDVMAEIIGKLLRKGIAYEYRGNIYCDPLRIKGFGRLFGLDLSSWPKKRRRFHQDTYPGIQWNRGDFILWHGFREGDAVWWETPFGKGRPAWNIQDPAMVSRHIQETLSVYCGGIDNLYRHHDYSLALLESVRPYPMARFWLHCRHLFINGKKMSKSKGNIHYTETLSAKGYSPWEIRFFLIYGHYRERLNYSDRKMQMTALKLRKTREIIAGIRRKAGRAAAEKSVLSRRLEESFRRHMDDDLQVRAGFDALYEELACPDTGCLTKEEAAGTMAALKKIDSVLQIFF
ncbi:MAG: cysteine--tRNA ligase [Thermodesulfovibrionales bacterium]